MKKRSWFKQFLWLSLGGFAILCALGIVGVLYLESTLPNVNTLKDVHLQVPLRVFAANGKLIAEYGAKRRKPVSLDQIPASVIDATIATEDKRFFEHSGVDINGLLRAAVVLITTGRKEQGGSTITMQVARNYFLSRRKTYIRKLREILLAYKIDHTISKEKVLELYFNKIFYGNRAYGIAAASEVYYGKMPNQLTLPQAAMLAGLPQAPSALNPLANPKAAIDRRNHVLTRMHDQKYITEQQYINAMQAPVTAKYHNLKPAVKAPYIAEMVRDEMVAEYGKAAYTKGLNVYTTVEPKFQADANNALRKAILAYDKRHGYRGPSENLGETLPMELSTWQKAISKVPVINQLQPAVVIGVNDDTKTVNAVLKTGQVITIPWYRMKWARSQFFRGKNEFLGKKPTVPSDILHIGDVIRTHQIGKTWSLDQLPQVEGAIIAMNPQTGGILALVGGFDYVHSKFNRAVQANRQPGSSFKPFIYSAALAKGYTLASMLNDAPVVLASTNKASGFWRPENDTKKFYGLTSLRQALGQSRNLTSIRLLQLITIPYAIDYATRFGFKPSQLPHGLSLALGTADATPLQMVTAYSTFANGGYKVVPHLINHITNSNGKVIFKTATPIVCEQCELPDNNNSAVATTPLTEQRPFAQDVITPQNAYLMTQAMKDVILHGTGRAALQLNRSDLAGKTGTTNDKVDAWFSGFDHHLVVTTWMGFDKPRSLFEYGAQAALPMWIDFMRYALRGKAESSMPQPPGIISVRVNPKTGELASPNNPNAKFEYFRQQYAPKASGYFANTGSGATTDTSDSLEQQIY